MNRTYAPEIIKEALSRIDIEQQQIEAEIEAFHSFDRNIKALSTTSSVERSPGINTVCSTGCNSLKKVRTAYQDTVMAVSHYETEYNDTVTESLQAEFGVEIAVALTKTELFDTQLKRALLSKVAEAVQEREKLLSALAKERDSIIELQTSIVDISAEIDTLRLESAEQREFGALDAYRSRLAVLKDQCEALVKTRQETIADHRRQMVLGSDGPDIQEYLYQNFEASYPVLSTLASLGGRTIELRTTVERAMCHAD